MFELIKYLKRNREVSLNHWRYRLLHWFFGVNKENAQSKLPRFFYTHWCPVVQFTNLLVLGLPLILLFRFVYLLGVGFFTFVDGLISLIPERKYEEPVELTEEEKIKVETSLVIQFLKENPQYIGKSDSADLCISYYSLKSLNAKTVQDILDKTSAKLKKIQEEEAARKAAMQQRIVFWVNISQVFVKWALFAFYIVATVGAIYFGTPLLISFIKMCFLASGWFLTINWFKFAFQVSCFLISVLVVAGIGLGIFTLLNKLGFLLDIILVPCAIVKDAVKDTFFTIYGFIEKTIEFFGMLFEENCPKITIVDDKE